MAITEGLKFVSNPDRTCRVEGAGWCRNKKITIPSTNSRYELVTTIGTYAFSSCSFLKEVTIPHKIKIIDEGAFFHCDGLEKINIGNKVDRIDDAAFYECSSLTDVTFGKNSKLKYIGEQAFRDCPSLTNIIFPDSLQTIGLCAFQGCKAFNAVSGIYKGLWIKNGKLYAKDTGIFPNQQEYKVGKSYMSKGKLNSYVNGQSYCTNLFDVFNHYCGEYEKDFVIAECEVSPENIGPGFDSIHWARQIKLTKLLSRQEVIDKMNQH